MISATGFSAAPTVEIAPRPQARAERTPNNRIRRMIGLHWFARVSACGRRRAIAPDIGLIGVTAGVIDSVDNVKQRAFGRLGLATYGHDDGRAGDFEQPRLFRGR